jgi:hypothetical protein
MAPKPRPKHARTTARRRRAAPRHAAPATGLLSVMPDTGQAAAVASIAVTVAGATVMSGSAYGSGNVVTVPASIGAIAAGLPGSGVGSGASDASAGGAPTSLATGTAGPSSSLATEAAGRPAFISIGSIGTTTSLIELGRNTDGSLEVPEDFGIAGWWRYGPRPGDPGPAVITGHLDSVRGPGVFAKLGRVKPGDDVVVTRRDGVQVRFIVTRIDRYPKRAFPTRNVYGPTDASELRVITCGGNFDRQERSYDDNIVVFARLASEASVPGSVRS